MHFQNTPSNQSLDQNIQQNTSGDIHASQVHIPRNGGFKFRRKLKAIIYSFLIIFFITGVFSSLYLLGQNQDNRQYAKESTGVSSTSITLQAGPTSVEELKAQNLLPASVPENFQGKASLLSIQSNGENLGKPTQASFKNIETIAVPLLQEGEAMRTIELGKNTTVSGSMSADDLAEAGQLYVWSGHSEKQANMIPDVSLNLVVGSDDSLIGTLYTTEGVFNIETTKDGSVVLYEAPAADLNITGEFLTPSEVEESFRKMNIDYPSSVVNTANNTVNTTNTANATNNAVDISISAGYTAAAKDRVGGATAIRNLIYLGIANTNTAFYNSDIPARLVVADVRETQYQERTASCEGCSQASADLTALLNNHSSNPELNDLTSARAETFADTTLLITTGEGYGGTAGIATMSITPNTVNEGLSFAIGSLSSGSQYLTNAVIPHEIGHIFGNSHDPDTLSGDSPNYPFGMGFRKDRPFGNNYLTLLSYSRYANDVIINAYSSPNVYFGEHQMGSTETGNNAKVIRDNVGSVSQFNGALFSGEPGTPGQGGGGPGTQETCDNGIKVGDTACASQGDTKQFRCMQPNPNQVWQEETCNASTCQGVACTGGIVGGGGGGGGTNPPPAPQVTCQTGNFQARFRLNYTNGVDHGWRDSGTYLFDSNQNALANFEQAVFMNGDTNQRWNGPTVVTINGTPYEYPNGEMAAVRTPYTAGTYKIAPKVGGVLCTNHEVTITLEAPLVLKACGESGCTTDASCVSGFKCVAASNGSKYCANPLYEAACAATPSNGACCVAPPQPPSGSFKVIFDPQTNMATVSFYGHQSQQNVVNHSLERCIGSSCTNFTPLTTIANVPNQLLTYAVAVPAGQVHRYRLRSWNGSTYSSYTPILNSSISWVFLGKPVCANGSTPTAPTKMTYALWPPNPLQWSGTAYITGNHTLNVLAAHSWNYAYIQLRLPEGALVPVGTPAHPKITYGTPFNWPMARIDRELPSGTYTINYRAPESICGVTVPPLSVNDFTATFRGNRTVLMNWSNQPNAISHRIDRCSGVNCTNFQYLTVLHNHKTTYTTPAIPQGQTHKFRIRAYNGRSFGPAIVLSFP